MPGVLPQKTGVDVDKVKFKRGYAGVAFVVPDRGAGVAPLHVFLHLRSQRQEAELAEVRAGSDDAGRIHAEDPRVYAEAQHVFEKQVAVFYVGEMFFQHVAAEGVEAAEIAVAEVAFFREREEAVEPAAHLAGKFRIDVFGKIVAGYVLQPLFRKRDLIVVKKRRQDYFAFHVLPGEDAGRPERGIGEESDAVLVEFRDMGKIEAFGVGAGVELQFAAPHDAGVSLAHVLHGQRRSRFLGIDLVAQAETVPQDRDQRVGLGGEFFKDGLAFFLVRHRFHVMDAVHVLAVFQLTLRQPDLEHLLQGMPFVSLLEKMDDVKRITFHG